MPGEDGDSSALNAAADPPSPPSTPSPHPNKPSPHPVAFDPFSINITSWEDWERMLLRTPPPPESSALPTPPKINLFSNDPLTFTPMKGPIDLYSPDHPVRPTPTPIMPSTPQSSSGQEEMQLDSDGGQEERGPEGNGIVAPPVNDAKELEFEWPSEEIKRACEEMFPRGDGKELPVLTWIVKEVPWAEKDMEDVQQR